MGKKITILKATGEKAPFSEDKYRLSLHKSGATDDQINSILNEIMPQLHDGMSTRDIYAKTHELMRKKKMFSSGGRYHLRQAILDLGPTGFPFEHFIAKVMEAQGFKTLIDQTISGTCIRHEIDVIAINGDKKLFIECKFHNSPGERCSIKTTLYVKARHDDIVGHTKKINYQHCYLVTNAKFSSESIDYGKCIGMNLLGWAYPHNNGLEKIIDTVGLHPITCLSSISKKLVHELVQRGIIFCHELVQNSSLLHQLGLKEAETRELLEECGAILRLK